MNPNEKLREVFEILLSRYPRLPILALHWIYLTNGEPSVLKEIDRVSPFSVLCLILLRMGWCGLYGIFLGLKIICLRLYLARTLKSLKKRPFDALAKSWVFPKSPLKNGEDFYLGDLGLRLKSEKISLLTLCGNVTGKNEFRFLSCYTSAVFPFSFPEMAFLSPWDVFRLWYQRSFCSLFLFFHAIKEKESFLRSVMFLAARDSVRHQTLYNAFFYYIGKRSAAYWKPKMFISLYEGNAWEKCLWLGIKEGCPSCKIVGFHHTILRQRALELLHPSDSVPQLKQPELILTTGSKTLEMMQPGYRRFSTKFVEFGSFRAGWSKDGIQKPKPKRKTILVTPEGLIPEMRILFAQALHVAAKLPDYFVVLRCHPAMSFEKVRPFLNQKLLSLSNVEVSQSFSILEDLKRSSILLYRGSSSVLYAILAGLKPFYWRGKEEESIDPLYELTRWREEVSSQEELLTAIQRYSVEPLEIHEPIWQTASEYVQEYIKPVSRESIQKLIGVFQ